MPEPGVSPLPNRNSGPRGHSLVEVVVAMAILAFIAVSVMSGFLYSMTETRRAFDRAQAAAWAQAELDYLRIKGYDALAATGFPRSVPPYDLTGNLAEPAIPPGFDHADVQITQVGGLLVKEVAVRLYRQPASPPYSALVTYVADSTTP